MLNRARITEYFQEQFKAGISYTSIEVAEKAIAQALRHKIESWMLEIQAYDEFIDHSFVKISRNIVQINKLIADCGTCLAVSGRQLLSVCNRQTSDV